MRFSYDQLCNELTRPSLFESVPQKRALQGASALCRLCTHNEWPSVARPAAANTSLSETRRIGDASHCHLLALTALHTDGLSLLENTMRPPNPIFMRTTMIL